MAFWDQQHSPASASSKVLSAPASAEACRTQKAEAAFTLPSEHCQNSLVKTALSGCVGMACWGVQGGHSQGAWHSQGVWHILPSWLAKLPFLQALLLLSPAQKEAPAALASPRDILDTEPCMSNQTTALGREWEQLCSFPDQALLSLVIKRRDFSLALYC